MKIAIVGPTHPYKGGIPQHTTALAHHLQTAGHQVTIVGWKHQYPFFYPGVQFVPDGKPELPLFHDSKRVLSWRNPAGWAAWARRLRKYDEVIFAWFVPTIQGPVVLTMMKALGKSGPKKVILCHNIVSHSASGPDKTLTKLAFSRADEILVHSEAQAEQVRAFTSTLIKIAKLPAHLPGQPQQIKHNGALRQHLLFFGLVRKYKGIDVLLKALAQAPDITLTIAGEMWGKQQANLEALIQELNLEKRVTLQPGYVPADQIAPLFEKADAQVLPYRKATGSQMVDMAFTHGVPVIASRTGSLGTQVRDGIDGLLVEPESVQALAAAIKHFYEAGVAQKLSSNIPQVSSENDWQAYVAALTN
ncbi:MAG TPA: glycosyltransferase family 4 protein [Candidatus Saccharimonadales bacterium]|nr:glycosyltransferase family 4 protein [Candidatus Saccharimonadales bacterium]